MPICFVRWKCSCVEDRKFGAAVGTTRCQDDHIFSIQYTALQSVSGTGQWVMAFRSALLSISSRRIPRNYTA